ncbi:NRAMP family divalent metal transporter [Luteibacter sahnii]|uniref:NRAMP family divalent metal transporter n=1 Tax=Luteibacter sahnii TaxID=3021977 RepID=UPI002A6B76AB|nr:divalent metal cation transporter [Luteibacter sp. PPL193]MDY1546961.1 divalent metal cation transporter [Luteibacter sp. PPL193]
MSDASESTPPTASPSRHGWRRRLGAGLVTGAADDDPSGIATYSQVGAQFGYGMLWTTVVTTPLMIGVQTVSARVGRVTGRGLADNMCRVFPRPWVAALVALLVLNNIVNLAADIGAMGQVLALLTGGHAAALALLCALVSLALETLIPFPRYAPLLKAMTMSLFAYVATACIIEVPWREVSRQAWPTHLGHDTLVAVTAVFGTTISPYLFFWQAAQEVEEEQGDASQRPLTEAPEQAGDALRRIGFDTGVGMTYSNVVAFFIMLTSAVVLRGAGITQVRSAADAAAALSPLAGPFASGLFAIGIVGTGLLAVPVLAASAAYAVAEVAGRPASLARTARQDMIFYGVLALATLAGCAVALLPIDPFRLLFWSAVVNGVTAVPLMAGVMAVAMHRSLMGRFAVRGPLLWLGWTTTAVMALVALGAIGVF